MKISIFRKSGKIRARARDEARQMKKATRAAHARNRAKSIADFLLGKLS